jgi:hypothetical protein
MSHSELRRIETWGSYGKNGDEPLTTRFIKDISDEHLKNIIEFMSYNEYFYRNMKPIMINEQNYRKEHNIYVSNYLKDFKFLKQK